jgi:hypothetical protein
MNAIGRLRRKNPVAFYAGVAGIIGGLGVIGLLLAKKN